MPDKEEEEIGMTSREVIEDFRTTDYANFIDYLNDWYYEEEEYEESNK